MVSRHIHVDPAPLAPVLIACICHKRFDYHRTSKNGEKMDRVKIRKEAPLMRGLEEVNETLTLRKTCMEEGLRQAVPELQQKLNAPLTEAQIETWIKSIAKRICNMCRHVGQALLKSKNAKKPTWVQEMMAEPSVANMGEEGDKAGGKK